MWSNNDSTSTKTSEEIIVLLSEKKNTIFNNIVLLSEKKNTIFNNIVLLSEEKNTIFDRLAHQHLQAADYHHCFMN